MKWYAYILYTYIYIYYGYNFANLYFKSDSHNNDYQADGLKVYMGPIYRPNAVSPAYEYIYDALVHVSE